MTGTTPRAIVVCDQWLGSNGYAAMKALRRAGWSVHVAPEWEYVPIKWRSPAMRAIGRAIRRAAAREFNEDLVRHARRLSPELVLVFKGTFVDGAALDRLREMRVRTYCFYPDVSVSVHGPWLPRALPRYDWVFTTKTFGVRDMRASCGVTRASVLPHAFDPDLHRPVPLGADDQARYGCDVSFIGTWSPKKERLLRVAAERRPDLSLRIWGSGWERARTGTLASAVAGHTVDGEEYVRAIRASAINLALLSEVRAGASDGDRITSRTFHIPACGGFMLHERTDEVLAVLREGEHLACFGDPDEMLERIDRYLAHPDCRARIAAQARAAVQDAHSWDRRILQILDHHREMGGRQ